MHRTNLAGCAAFAVSCLLALVAAPSRAETHAFVGAHIITVAGDEIADGVLVVENGKIATVGPAGSTAIPTGAVRHDVTGKVIMPGLVDTHSHIGGVGGRGRVGADPAGGCACWTRSIRWTRGSGGWCRGA